MIRSPSSFALGPPAAEAVKFALSAPRPVSPLGISFRGRLWRLQVCWVAHGRPLDRGCQPENRAGGHIRHDSDLTKVRQHFPLWRPGTICRPRREKSPAVSLPHLVPAVKQAALGLVN